MLGKLAYEAHEVIGLAAFGVIALHWIWSIISQSDGSLKHLFPWKGEARKHVINDITSLTKGQLPASDKHGGLAGFVHGLGFLTVSIVAVTGIVIFLTFPESGEPGFVAEAFAELHESIAALVWTYWIAHGGIAVLHHLAGNNTVKQMFNLKGNSSIPGDRKESSVNNTHFINR